MDFVEIEYRERGGSWGMSELQSHDYFELYFLIDGRRSFFLGDRAFNIKGRAFCIIPPFSMHKTSGESYKRININVSPKLLSKRELSFLTSLAERAVFSLDGERYDHLIQLLWEASGIVIPDSEEEGRVSLAFVHTIIYMLENAALLPIDHSARVKDGAPDTLMLEVATYLNEHYREPLTLEEISEHFYISKNSLSEKFKEAMSCTVMQYLAFLRLSRAKELLQTTELGMEKIAEMCGYSSPNYFSLIFKKSVGISPRGYRKAK